MRVPPKNLSDASAAFVGASASDAGYMAGGIGGDDGVVPLEVGVVIPDWRVRAIDDANAVECLLAP